MTALKTGYRILVICVISFQVSCDSKETHVPSLTYYQDIEPILNTKCATCHSNQGIAPFILETYNQAFEYRELIRSTVANGTMPPWQPSNACNTYQGDYSLTQSESRALVQWVEEGAYEGQLSDSVSAEDSDQSNLSRADLILTMPEPYTPRVFPDDYRCFVLDWEAGDDTGFVTGFNAIPGNSSVVHHVIAYLLDPDQVADAESRDAQDEGPGYRCFGGPSNGSGLVQWLGAWAPGSLGSDFPEGTGMKVKPGSKIVLQLHYNVSYAAPAPDQTSIEVKIDPDVDKEASILLWVDYRWPRNQAMPIPAGINEITYSFSSDASTWLPFLSSGPFESGDSFQIHSAGIHMHELGVKGRLWLDTETNHDNCLLDIPAWDFAWQQTYRLHQPITVHPGDNLGIECVFSNDSPRLSTIDGTVEEPYDSNWGDGTRDEMCLGIFYISEL